LWVPLSALEARRVLPEPVSKRVDELAASLGGGAALADATLLAARLARPDSALRATGAVDAYLDVLETPDVPLLWPPPLRAALLRGTSAGPATESQAALSGRLHEVCAEGFAAASEPAPEAAAFRRAQAVLLSRAHSGEGKPLALVAGLCLLNHVPNAPSARVAMVDGSFALVATRSLPPHEPLTIDYGTAASHRLVRLYGFLPSEDDADDEADVRAAAAAQQPKAGAGAAGATGATAGVAAAEGVQSAGVAGEEVLLPLLPTAAELASAPPAVLSEVDSLRAALSSVGLPSSTLRLAVGSDGTVALPLALPGMQSGALSAEAATALRVVAGAAEAQRLRQREGAAACEAVRRLGGDAPSEEAARRRARLCARLHRSEGRVMDAVLAQFERA
jgi:hypothetical protein